MILSFLRTVLLYLLLIIVIRIMGKRQIGEMEASEFVVTMMAANLSTEPIENPGSPILYGVIAIAAILGAELSLSLLTMDSLSFRRLLCGSPVILIDDGVLLQMNLRKTRITMEELQRQLREKQVLDLTTVQYAILETNGTLSVFLYPEHQPATAADMGARTQQACLPVTLIQDGKRLEDNMVKAGKDGCWLAGVLKDRGLKEKQCLLLSVEKSGKILCIGKEGRR